MAAIDHSYKTKSRLELETEIAKALESDIIFGRLEPGARLVEDALLERFGGTRHLIRGALVRLETLGIVVRERNKGASVRAFTAKEVRQVYEVREMVQREAALRIPLPAPAAAIAELEAIHESYCQCIEVGDKAVHDLNDHFHLVLFGLCGNPYLTKLVRDHMGLTYAIRAKNLADPTGLAVSKGHHALMIEYLKGDDNWVLAQLCVDHLRPSKEGYLRSLAVVGTPDAAL